MAKKFKVKTRFNIKDKIIIGLCRFFKKRPEFVNLIEGDLPEICIMIGNHNGAGGPFHYRAFMDNRFMSWGAHQMCESFGSRWRYLYYIFYRQKLGYGKLRAFFMSLVLGFIAPLVYGVAGIIPVYYDMRIVNTYRYSIECFENGVSVFVLPEASDEGYKEKIEGVFPGFLQLAKLYYKQYNADIPIYTLRYNKRPKKIVVGKPMYYQELAKEYTDEEILQIFIDYMNSLKEY